jgi:nitronate monooxygenase
LSPASSPCGAGTAVADPAPGLAALTLDAAGAVIGTRFQATAESLADPAIKKAIIEGRGETTERSGILDIARGFPVAKQVHRSHARPPVP